MDATRQRHPKKGTVMNLEKQLRESDDIEPQRPLHPQFTQNIIEHLEAHPRPAGLSERIKEYIKMKLTKSPLRFATTIVAIALIGGTSYATVINWPSITATFSGQQTLPNGNRIVSVDISNCPVADDSGVHLQDGKRIAYYEVRKNAGLSNNQVVSEVQGDCEERAITAQQSLITNNYTSLTGQSNFDGGGTYQVDSIDSSRLMVTLNKKYGRGFVKQNYTRFSPHMAVYDGTKKAQLSAIKGGDTVSIITTSSVPPELAETQDPYRLNTTNLTIIGLIKHPANTGDAAGYYKHISEAYVPVHIDKSAPGGFTRNYQPKDFDSR